MLLSLLEARPMLAIRLAKIFMVAAIVLFASLVTFGNPTDYGINFAFVQHVLSMDSIFPSSTIGYRAITSVALHHAAYAAIIAAEAVTALLCWIGAGLIARHIRSDGRLFNRAKTGGVARAYTRLSALAGRLHDHRRRVVRHVAVEGLKRRAKHLPHRHGDHGSTDLRGSAG
jgi:predicted small integral membrane protein